MASNGLRTNELAQAPLRGDVPEAQRAIRGADEQRVEARRVAAEAGDAVRVGQRRHERLREHAVELDGVQGTGVLDGLLKRVQRRVQVPVHLRSGPKRISTEQTGVADNICVVRLEHNVQRFI